MEEKNTIDLLNRLNALREDTYKRIIEAIGDEESLIPDEDIAVRVPFAHDEERKITKITREAIKVSVNSEAYEYKMHELHADELIQVLDLINMTHYAEGVRKQQCEQLKQEGFF